MSDIATLLAQHEGKTLEFKRDVSSPGPIMKTLVAFANGSGGSLLIGIEDGTRHVVGVEDPTGIEEQMARWVVDRIEPRLVPDLRVLPWRNTNVLQVEVFPSPLRPHYVKEEGRDKGVYVRVGSTNRRADPAQVDEIRRQVLGRAFDEEPAPDFSLEELDVQAAADCFAPLRRLNDPDLETLNLLVRYQNRIVPTTGGILLFGRRRLETFPEAMIRAGLFAGIDRTRILDSQDIRSYLPLAVEDAIRFVQRNSRQDIQIQGIRNQPVPQVPLIALREAIINAVVHADYAQRGSPLRIAIFNDRLEIENPGGIPPGLTLDDLRRGVSKLRNRVIGRVFHELGLIEQWGSGIQRMTSACHQAGLPEPELEEIGTGFRVTFRLIPGQKSGLEVLDRRILELLAGSEGLSPSQIASAIGRTTRTTREYLRRLIGLGLVVEQGSSPNDPRKVIRLTERPLPAPK